MIVGSLLVLGAAYCGLAGTFARRCATNPSSETEPRQPLRRVNPALNINP
jgi:hypothetical protein